MEGGGNVPAQLSIARRLATRGHDVHVLADRAVESEVLSAGCRFHPFVHAPQHNMRDKQADVIRDWEPSTPPAQIRRIGDHVMFGPSAAYARDLLEAIGRLRPDALAVDCLSFGGIIGAEKSGLPAALLVHFPFHASAAGATPFGLGLRPARGPAGRLRDRLLTAVLRRMFGFGLAPVNAARRELGLTPIRHVFDQFHVLPRSLVLTSREYDFVPTGLPGSVRYVGPQLDDPAWPERWTPPWSGDSSDPLVVVSLGSTYQRQERAFGAIVEALGRVRVRGLAMLGPIDRPAAPAPRNVTVIQSAPHEAVLPLASVVVCHGGHGTVMKSLARGVPVMVMPFGRDQKDNGARVEVSGSGLSLSSNASPARIAEAVHRLLEEPAFREAARAMSNIITRDLRADRAVAEFEALAAEGLSAHSAARGASGQ